jgi:hypothetical protein
MKRARFIRVGLLLLTLCSWLSVAFAQQTPAPGVDAVEAVGMTVADMERSIGFYSGILSFERVSDVEATGSAYEHLQGVFGLRMRVVRMRLGEEFIERWWAKARTMAPSKNISTTCSGLGYHHHVAGSDGPRHRVSGVSGATRWASDAHRRARQ